MIGAAAGLGLLPFIVNGCREERTPEEARHRGVRCEPCQQARSPLARLGEILLPGADAAGIVHFVDHHVSVPPADSLLMIRYLDWPPPFAGLYRGG